MFYKNIAHIYDQSRPPYPQEIYDLILSKLPESSRELYIDLGCGTGQLLIPLSSHFEQAIGIDPDANMLTIATQKIQEQKLSNIELVQKTAEEYLVSLPKDIRINCATAGRSFHWMNQELVASQIYAHLSPGGIFATLGESHGGIWKRETAWAKAVRAIIMDDFPGKAPFVPARGHDSSVARIKANLAAVPFASITDYIITARQTWNIDTVINLFYSGSGFLEWLGQDFALFEQKVREALHKIEPTGTFEELCQFGITICVK